MPALIKDRSTNGRAYWEIYGQNRSYLIDRVSGDLNICANNGLLIHEDLWGNFTTIIIAEEMRITENERYISLRLRGRVIRKSVQATGMEVRRILREEGYGPIPRPVVRKAVRVELD